MIFLFTPVLVRLWARQADRGAEPFAISKMVFACFCVTAAYLVMAAGAAISRGGKASPIWLVGYFALITIGELYLSPIGLALMSRSAPVRLRSMMMGLWFATTFPADIFARLPRQLLEQHGQGQFLPDDRRRRDARRCPDGGLEWHAPVAVGAALNVADVVRLRRHGDAADRRKVGFVWTRRLRHFTH